MCSAGHPARLVVSVLLLALGAGGLLPSRARADEGQAVEQGVDRDAQAYSAFRRQVVVSEIRIAPLDAFPTPAAMLGALRRLASHEVTPVRDFWRFHFVAFLDPAPDTAEVRVVLTDVSEPGRRHEVKVFELPADPGVRTLQVNDFVVTPEMGFQHGHRYELAVTRGADEMGSGGRADVLAVGAATLK